MKFTGQFVQIKLDQVQFAKELEAYLQKLIEEAATVWLVAVLGRVPLWSGMARASLLELSRLINGTVILTPLKAKSRIPQGEVLGTAVPEYKPAAVKITIDTNVPHYNLQEYTKLVSPTSPWHSLEAGKKAYEEVAKKATLPIPRIQPRVIRVN